MKESSLFGNEQLERMYNEYLDALTERVKLLIATEKRECGKLPVGSTERARMSIIGSSDLEHLMNLTPECVFASLLYEATDRVKVDIRKLRTLAPAVKLKSQ